MKKIRGYYFSEGYTLPNGDNRPIKLGETHSVIGNIVPCKKGLHSSLKALDALSFEKGNIVWIVESWGNIKKQPDKICARNRTYIAGGIDIEKVLREFARWCDLQVIDNWDCPVIVKQWLKTGAESIRNAAYSAANAANAANAAYSAAYSAAKIAANAAAYNAAYAAEKEKQNKKLEEMIDQAIKETGK